MNSDLLIKMIKKSFDDFSSNLKFFLPLAFFDALTVGIAELLSIDKRGFALDLIKTYPILVIISFVALFIFSLYVQLIMQKGALQLTRGEKIGSIIDVARSVKGRVMQFLILMLVVGGMILGGMILLVIPGFILFSILFLSTFIFLDENLGVNKTIKRSFEFSKNIRWFLFFIVVMNFVCVHIANKTLFGVIILSPFKNLLVSNIYFWLKDKNSAKVSEIS